MNEKIRRHTIVVTRDTDDCITGLRLEKDWYSSEFADAYDYKVVERRKQGDFYFVGFGVPITKGMAKLFTDNVITGKIVVVDLRHYSMDAQNIRLRRVGGA